MNFDESQHHECSHHESHRDTSHPDKSCGPECLWQEFFRRQSLDARQQEQYKQYYELMIRTNNIHNLTAITNLPQVITDHFEDSLVLKNFVNLERYSMLADIGTGAGFPALPLKIAFPHLKLVLIEVNHKKIAYLEQLVELLGLEDVIIDDRDWRNFLRMTDYPIDIFCARASLPVEELVRIFSSSSPYHHSLLVYWASRHWKADKKVIPYIMRQEWYVIPPLESSKKNDILPKNPENEQTTMSLLETEKKRKLVFLKALTKQKVLTKANITEENRKKNKNIDKQ